MKIIGLPNKTLQYVIYRLQDLDISFPEDERGSEILVCQDLEHYKKYGFNLIKNQLKYKVIIFLDFIKNLKRINGIQILENLPPSFIPYVKNKCTFSTPTVRTMKDTEVFDRINEIETNVSLFNRVIYPLLYKGLTEKKKKNEVMRSIVYSIKSLVRKESDPPITKYVNIIKPKYMKLFLKWLQTNEAKQVCNCLLTKTVKYGLDSFEINYLISMENNE